MEAFTNVVDVYDVKKFLNFFPFHRYFGVKEREHTIPGDYSYQMEADGHRYFDWERACRGSLLSYNPYGKTKFKIIMTIK